MSATSTPSPPSTTSSPVTTTAAISTDPTPSAPVLSPTTPLNSSSSTSTLLSPPIHPQASSSRASQVPPATNVSADGRQGPPPATSVKLSIYVPRDAVGFIIGRRGDTVRHMIGRSKAYIHVDRDDTNPNAPDRLFHIEGDHAAVATARNLIIEKVNAVLYGRPHVQVRDATSPTTLNTFSGHPSPDTASSAGHITSDSPPAPDPPSDIRNAVDTVHRELDPNEPPISAPVEMWIPRGCVGMIIGHGGQVITEMQEKANATIVVHNDRMDSSGSKLLTITGGEREKAIAKSLVENVLDRATPRSRYSDTQTPNNPHNRQQGPRPHQHQSQRSNDPSFHLSRDRSRIPGPHSNPSPRTASVPPEHARRPPFIPTQHPQEPSWPITPAPAAYNPRQMADFFNMPQPMNPWGMIPPAIPIPHMRHQVVQTPMSQPHHSGSTPRASIVRAGMPFPQGHIPQPNLETSTPSHPATPTMNATPPQNNFSSPTQQTMYPSTTPIQPVQPQLQSPYDSSNHPLLIHGNPSTPMPLPHGHQHPMMGAVNQPQPLFQIQTQNLPPQAAPGPHLLPEHRQFHPGTYPGGNFAHPRPMYIGGIGPQPGMQGGWPYAVSYEGGVFPTGPMYKQHTRQIIVPGHTIEAIMGPNWETIHDIHQRSGAVILIGSEADPKMPNSDRYIYVSGSVAATVIAEGLINDIVTRGSARLSGQNSQNETILPTAQGGESNSTNTTSGPDSGNGGAVERTGHLPIGNTTNMASSDNGLVTEDSAGQQTEGVTSDHSREGTQSGSEGRTGAGEGTKTNLGQCDPDRNMIEISIPDGKVGMIIGKRGSTIKQLQQQSGARIEVSKEADMANKKDRHRSVRITGKQSHVEEAQRLIHSRIDPVDGPTGYEESVVGGEFTGGSHAEFQQTILNPVGIPDLTSQMHHLGLTMQPAGVPEAASAVPGVRLVQPNSNGGFIAGGLQSGLGQNMDCGGGVQNTFSPKGYYAPTNTYAESYGGTRPSEEVHSNHSSQDDITAHGQ